MLHVDGPKIRKIKTTRVEAVIAIPADEPMDAKGFLWSVDQAMKELREEGSAAGYDDEFHVRVRDEEIVLYFEKEKEL